MYLTSILQFKEAIKLRRKNRAAIRFAVNEFIKRRYGISDFCQFSMSSFAETIVGQPKQIDENQTYGVLARQIPGVCAEDIAFHLLTQRLGIVPCTPAFSRDVFVAKSCDKLFRVNVPFISWSKKSNPVIQPKWVITGRKDNGFTDLDMVRMDKMAAGDCSLPEFHRRMQSHVFGAFTQPMIWSDISTVYGQVLAMAKQANMMPGYVWRSDGDWKDCKSPDYTEEEALNLTVRPSSKWYYPLYLSMFMDGTFVLLETYDNEAGGVPEAKILFDKTVQEIYSATGFKPLVVKTFPLTRDMLFVNQHILDEPKRAAETLSSLRYWTDDTVSMTRFFADQVIHFR